MWMNNKLRMMLAGTGVILALCACTGPETRVLPRQNILPEEPYELTGNESVLEEANPFYLQEALDFLARTPRECGSAAETNAAEYIKRLLMEYEYEVILQRFPLEDGERYGTNVIAVKDGEQMNGDIILIAASHDTAAGSPGANDNASGVVALLETARLVSRIPTDTELRFVSFSGTGQQQGPRYYLESLTEEERSHIVGMLYLDTLGYIHDDAVILGTIDGNPTILGDYLNETVKTEFNDIWEYRMDDNTGNAAFNICRIPAVRITQAMTAFEQGTPQDRSGIVDVERLGEVSRMLSQTLAKMMNEETGSDLLASQAGRYRRDGAILQRTDRGIPFGKARNQVEAHYGGSGILMEAAADGSSIYQYPVKWLGVDQIILSDFRYEDDVLAEITLAAAAAGIESGEMKERLSGLYGEAEEVTDETGTVWLLWEDRLGNLAFMLRDVEESFIVRVSGRESQVLELAGFPMDQIAGRELPTVQMKAAAELADHILTPAMRGQIDTVILFTDGIGGQVVYWHDSDTEPESEGNRTEPERETENGAEKEDRAGFVLYLDVADIADEDGNYCDYNDSCRQLVRACAVFFEQNYGAAFLQRFPECRVDDFYLAFQYFVLSRQPDNDIIDADAQTMFFYQSEELTAARDAIRNQLGWNEYE